MSNYSDFVTKGINLLDEQVPDWRTKIDPERLNLASCEVCVLGQIFGDYDTGLEQLNIDGYDYGFNTYGSMAELTEAWRDALGENSVLVEVGDVYTDSEGCCGFRVAATKVVELDGKSVTVYIGEPGSVYGGKLTPRSNGTLEVHRKPSFEPGGAYPKFLDPFPHTSGDFVTGSDGKVYWVLSGGRSGRSRLVDSSSKIVPNGLIKEPTTYVLPDGRKFSDTVKAV